MAEREGLSLSITTKSNQVVRDIDLLKRITERSSITIHMTVTTLRTRLARLIEPRAPRPDLRLEAVRKLREAGIAVGVNIMPILPGITDREADLDALIRAARDAGAQWVAASVVFLMPASWKTFMGFLDEKFPRLAAQYREWYRGYGYAPESYRKEIAERVAGLRRKHGIESRPFDPMTSPERTWKSPQLQIDWKNGEQACPRMNAERTTRPRTAATGKRGSLKSTGNQTQRTLRTTTESTEKGSNCRTLRPPTNSGAEKAGKGKRLALGPVLVPAAAARPVRGMKLKSVSRIIVLFALVCLGAFRAGRPPVSAARVDAAPHAKETIHVSRAKNRRVSGAGSRQGHRMVRQSAGVAAVL